MGNWFTCHFRYCNLFHELVNTTSASIEVESWGGGEVPPVSKTWHCQMASSEVFLHFDNHKRLPNQQLIISLASYLVIYSRMASCQVVPELFKDHPSTHGHQADLRRTILYTRTVGLLMQLSNIIEKCILKPFVFKTAFSKSGHIWFVCIATARCLLVMSPFHLMLVCFHNSTYRAWNNNL